jgi:hypothetical protein
MIVFLGHEAFYNTSYFFVGQSIISGVLESYHRQVASVACRQTHNSILTLLWRDSFLDHLAMSYPQGICQCSFLQK